jgi:hypothetical protein
LETSLRSPSGQPAETVVAVVVGDDVTVRDSSTIGMGYGLVIVTTSGDANPGVRLVASPVTPKLVPDRSRSLGDCDRPNEATNSPAPHATSDATMNSHISRMRPAAPILVTLAVLPLFQADQVFKPVGHRSSSRRSGQTPAARPSSP